MLDVNGKLDSYSALSLLFQEPPQGYSRSYVWEPACDLFSLWVGWTLDRKGLGLHQEHLHHAQIFYLSRLLQACPQYSIKTQRLFLPLKTSICPLKRFRRGEPCSWGSVYKPKAGEKNGDSESLWLPFLCQGGWRAHNSGLWVYRPPWHSTPVLGFPCS